MAHLNIKSDKLYGLSASLCQRPALTRKAPAIAAPAGIFADHSTLDGAGLPTTGRRSSLPELNRHTPMTAYRRSVPCNGALIMKGGALHALASCYWLINLALCFWKNRNADHRKCGKSASCAHKTVCLYYTLS